MSYFPMGVSKYTVRHGKLKACAACKEPTFISYLREGYCGPCWRKAEALWDRLDSLDRLKYREGQSKTPEAQHVRNHCTSERKAVKKELAVLGLPATRPSDKRVYGPGQAPWQKGGN